MKTDLKIEKMIAEIEQDIANNKNISPTFNDSKDAIYWLKKIDVKKNDS